jgi:hypothetical protein
LHLRIGHPTQNNEMCRALPLTTRYVAVHGEQIDVTCLLLPESKTCETYYLPENI